MKHINYSACVFLLGITSIEGLVTQLTSFSQDLRIYAAEYVEMLETVVKLLMDEISSKRPYVFQ